MADKKMTRLEQMGIIALAVVIACFVYFKKVYEPECGRFKKLRTELNKLSKEVKDLKWKEGGKDTFAVIREKEEELETAKAELKKARMLLADKEGLSDMLTRVSRLAGRCDLTIREFSPAEAGEKDPFLKRTYHKLVMAGNFLDFKYFLNELALLPRAVTIERVAIEREVRGEKLKIVLSLAI